MQRMDTYCQVMRRRMLRNGPRAVVRVENGLTLRRIQSIVFMGWQPNLPLEACGGAVRCIVAVPFAGVLLRLKSFL